MKTNDDEVSRASDGSLSFEECLRGTRPTRKWTLANPADVATINAVIDHYRLFCVSVPECAEAVVFGEHRFIASDNVERGSVAFTDEIPTDNVRQQGQSVLPLLNGYMRSIDTAEQSGHRERHQQEKLDLFAWPAHLLSWVLGKQPGGHTHPVRQ